MGGTDARCTEGRSVLYGPGMLQPAEAPRTMPAACVCALNTFAHIPNRRVWLAVHRNEAGEVKRLLVLDAAQGWSTQEEVRR